MTFSYGSVLPRHPLAPEIEATYAQSLIPPRDMKLVLSVLKLNDCESIACYSQRPAHFSPSLNLHHKTQSGNGYQSENL